jgi:thiol:disulfide interchange protein
MSTIMRFVYAIALLIYSFSLSAQIYNPVQWKFDFQKLEDGKYQLTYSATIEEGWKVYSQYLETDDGPVRTGIYYDDATHYSLEGNGVETGHKKEGYDPVFDMNVISFSDELTITQTVQVSDPTIPITGFLEFMACDDEKCLPPAEEYFSFSLTDSPSPKEEKKNETSLVGEATSYFNLAKPDLNEPLNQCEAVSSVAHSTSKGKGWLNIFFLGLIGGLIALLTPCVFPMIPLTVSYFTKKEGTQSSGVGQAFLYGFFILLVYLVISIPFHLMDSINPDILNDISTNIWLNIGFFVVFLFFAFSFFGFYELTLPSSWTNKANSAEGIGGVLGTFFMALTLALVSFSCTGPILGSLLAGALTADGGAWQLTAGMAGFGTALALPFGLFAAFPSWMKSLPKSGGWLNSVKVVLGFLELALAFKFLSNADLVKKWGLLKIEPFLAIWIIIFVGLTLYLFGKIKFPHDSPIKKLSVGRWGLSFISLAFTIYLISGFRTDPQTQSYQPLGLLSGLAPPVCYSIWKPCDCPQDFNCFKDLESGLAYAKSVNKPILLDFTGHACVNCRKMEEHVWPEQPVYSTIKEDYVLISLYVDEKIPLPESEQIMVERINGGQRKLKTVGNKWSHFQTEYFQTNAQPYYVLMSAEGVLLTPPVGYVPDVEEYQNFLECGLQAFQTLQ